ncbi:unnamed protein product, partial [Ectocarpus sp. 12 AP-2014]
AEQPATQNERARAIAAGGSRQDQIMYAGLPPALLPKGLRAALSTPQSGVNTPSRRHSSNTAAAASSDRFSDFVRGMVRGTRGHRETTAAIASKLEGKVVYLDSLASGQTEAQSAGARAERQAGRATKRGLSGKCCKQMGLNALEARNGGSIPFRDLLGLHGVWKNYAARLVSKYSSHKVLQQRILSADLQGCYLTVSRASASSLVNVAGIVLRETANTFQLVTPAGKTLTILKRSCAVRLAFGDRVVTLDGGALMGRRGGGARQQQKGGKGRGPGPGGGSDDPAALPLPTAAL